MKNKPLILIMLCLFCVNSVLAQKFTIKIESIFTSENESARLQHVKSAIDNQGKIHLVFTGFENMLFYGTNNNGEWSFQKLMYVDPDFNDSINIAFYPNIAIDNSDNIHIAIFDRYKEKLYYAKKNVAEGEFIFENVKFSPEPLRFSALGDYTDMAIDKNGGLHIICRADYTDQNEHIYRESAVYLNKPSTSKNWQLQVLIQTNEEQYDNSWYFGNNSSIACFNEKVYAAIGGSNELHFGTRDISGGFWEIERLLSTSDNFINSDKDMLSLAVAPNGSIKFAFFDRTDDESSPYHGLTIFSQNKCNTNKWMSYNGFKEPLEKNFPAMAIDNNGKAYIALGKEGFALYHQTCDCNAAYEQIFGDNNSADFVDMVIDKNNIVHTFFTSNQDNNLYYLSAIPEENTQNCNYLPIITAHTGKTNIAPGEEWTGTITASDPECDQINFHTIIKPDYVNINDKGDGTATIHAKIPEGEGFGNVAFTVFVRDNKHQDINNEVSAITFNLKLTQEGKEKGSINIENKCQSSGSESPAILN